MNWSIFTQLRQKLHQHPELSGQEVQTAQMILDFNADYPADQVLEKLGGAGLAFVYQGAEAGPTVLLRCELDALPIQEVNDFAYRSLQKGIAHKCGHDGHMAILSSLAARLHQERPERGRVILLYQPAEENGQGAQAVYDDPQFASLRPDYVFALHNLPGYPLAKVLLKEGIFTCASQAIDVQLFGKTAHAAYPEEGLSPATALTELLRKFPQLSQSEKLRDRYSLVTLVHAQLGEKAAGVAPGQARLMATLRAESNEAMDLLSQEAYLLTEQIARHHGLEVEMRFIDRFLANNNAPEACQIIRASADQAQQEVLPMMEPIRFSEDFGVFTSHFPGAMFGLGAGENCPRLHNPDYDFPEELIPIGHALFWGILEELVF